MSKNKKLLNITKDLYFTEKQKKINYLTTSVMRISIVPPRVPV